MWNENLKKSFSDLSLLCDYLELSRKQRSYFLEKSPFPLLLPLRLSRKITKRTMNDPLLLQFVPAKKETVEKKGFTQDPLQEKNFCTGRILQKYFGRALLFASPSCGMHCRFCFRKHFPPPTSSLEESVEDVRKNTSLTEVILSGGDPLSLSNLALEKLLLSIESIPHIQRIRIHTRFPIGYPERIDEGFLSLLQKLKKPLFFVLHTNHPNELDDDLFASLRKIRLLGHTLLSQSVLLKGINDDLQTLKKLYETLINQNILPYYLHKLDHVSGASHFQTSNKVEKQLRNELKNVLPGYGVPKFVQEIAKEKSKSELL
jgi:EF-P beta-lysylation protein EpmB